MDPMDPDDLASKAATNTSGFSIWSIAIKAMERRAFPVGFFGPPQLVWVVGFWGRAAIVFYNTGNNMT